MILKITTKAFSLLLTLTIVDRRMTLSPVSTFLTLKAEVKALLCQRSIFINMFTPSGQTPKSCALLPKASMKIQYLSSVVYYSPRWPVKDRDEKMMYFSLKMKSRTSIYFLRLYYDLKPKRKKCLLTLVEKISEYFFPECISKLY